jgi:hypothetical protein
MNTGRLASRTDVEILLNRDSKSDRGFNHDELGRLLIPVQHIEEYSGDPVGCVSYVCTADMSSDPA